ncbi:DNA repair protein RAD16-like isoform X1 [Coffea arabica]|uniref:DNA repair protein RAD16-like isoform X1 n=1 Tax=Coffea arabica TaxID=13443 RepID=A0A6P6S5H1_COFAR|nr:DNA repair protein RAD16-like [Coffea arabica]
MNLRSRASKGKDIVQYIESSDDDEQGRTDSSDSDIYIISDCEDEVCMHMLDEHEGKDIPDINLEPTFEISDDDIQDNVSKRRKVGPVKMRGRRRNKNLDVVLVSVDRDRECNQMDTVFEDIADQSEKKSLKRKSKGHKRPILVWEALQHEIERWIKENEANDVDLSNQNEILAETVEPPANLIIPLLRYQKEWLAWALKQEESTTRGGILADEMGMGKTAQAIALVVAKQEIQKAISEPSLVASAPSSSSTFPAVKGTLVICPLVAVVQWVSEIDRFTTKGSNKVLVYHGSHRGRNIDQFSEYDFVITTYSIVEAEYRRNVMPPKHKCQWCGKLLYEHKMSVHLKYFCGPDAIKTAKLSKQQRKKSNSKTTTSKQNLEFDEDDAFDSNGDMQKRGRKKGAKTSNGIGGSGNAFAYGIPADIGESSSTKKSILHSVKWERIILDEAHYIKDRRSSTTRAVFALQSLYKWALSGTPLQNRVGELYSLVRFLEIVPYSYYYCKDCDCRSLDYSTSTDCPHCPHKSVRHFCWWNRHVASPIKYAGNLGEGRKAMLLLKHRILKSIVLRRTKKGRAADLALPPRIVTLRRDELDIKEEDYYTSLYNESQAQFNTYIEANTLMNNYAHIFDLLTRLRQAVDHPYLVVYSSTAAGRGGSIRNAPSGEVCGLCHENAEDAVVTSCTHVFCKSCLIDFSASMGQISCPSCAKLLTVDFTGNKENEDQMPKTTIKGFRPSSILNRIRLDDFQTSTKIDALREEIRFMVERDGSAKGIVFSQFTSFLDLIHYSLQKSGVSCVQLVGSMSMAARDAAIKKFTEDPDCRIFLMSLKAGGVALNLTVASHVFLMDPWWNPAVERQAQDRIHRIGQFKPIRIVRFVIKDTVEERILKLQEKKELVFEGTVGGSSEALAKLTEADLRFLFLT